MKALTIKNLNKTYLQAEGKVIADINLEVEEGQILALLGESGSGKSTLLRTIAGLEHPDSGTIQVMGDVLVNEGIFLEPETRNIGLVFQEHTLFPHLTVADNVGFGLQKLSRQEKEKRVDEVLDLVALKELKSRYPHQLSGGQQQRIALARALAPKPNLLLLDEPFSNLDNVLKDKVREEVRQILKKANVTVIFVTHDTKDALMAADQIALIDGGKLLQSGEPSAMYHHPAHEKVARFFGQINLIESKNEEGNCMSTLGPLPVKMPLETKKAKLLIRPEHINIAKPSDSNFKGVVTNKSYLGDHTLLWLLVAPEEGNQLTLIIKVANKDVYEKGQTVHFEINYENACFLDVES